MQTTTSTLSVAAGRSFIPSAATNSGVGIWGSGKFDIYAAANETIVHSTGGVWGSGSTDVYAVGSGGLILHLP